MAKVWDPFLLTTATLLMTLRNRRPSFSFGVMLKIFILAMLGITIQQNVYYVGLHLISPTVASALGNVIPAFTFLLAIVLRMEKLNLKTVRGRAKLAGAIFCITGALIFTFWKGSALMLFGYFACSVSLVLQASICEIYPAKLTMNAVMCFFAALQSSALSLIFERNASSWRMFPLFTHLILCIVFVWCQRPKKFCKMLAIFFHFILPLFHLQLLITLLFEVANLLLNLPSLANDLLQ
ncbi:WAT1-related protein At3g56620-like [Zingiber officinale]|uniref:WAT1-related protein At3g56620-like n=1 Tax=Zingiber officinale TaxID=94328 RepID=UPI001C4D0F11|nr:WAT1-related protein At3g56620-like [Zingiber officinale]